MSRSERARAPSAIKSRSSSACASAPSTGSSSTASSARARTQQSRSATATAVLIELGIAPPTEQGSDHATRRAISRRSAPRSRHRRFAQRTSLLTFRRRTLTRSRALAIVGACEADGGARRSCWRRWRVARPRLIMHSIFNRIYIARIARSPWFIGFFLLIGSAALAGGCCRKEIHLWVPHPSRDARAARAQQVFFKSLVYNCRSKDEVRKALDEAAPSGEAEIDLLNGMLHLWRAGEEAHSPVEQRAILVDARDALTRYRARRPDDGRVASWLEG